MNIWSYFSRQHARAQWDSGLLWWRLRYKSADKPTHCLNLLSQPEACGRLALYYQPGGPVSQLYLGVPSSYGRLLQQMALDFHLSLQPVPDSFAGPSPRPLTAVAHLAWDEPFLAHLVAGAVFIHLRGQKGYYLPCLAGEHQPTTWCLPDPPPLGLTTQPDWSDTPPGSTFVRRSDAAGWPMGRTISGVPLSISGPVNLYGRNQATAEWLVQMIQQMMVTQPNSLVVIDGVGNVVPQLKRKTAITQQLGKALTYIDLDNDSISGGFNPLAVVPGETDPTTIQRWQQWFAGMKAQPQAISLLPQAYQEGVRTILGLYKWLQKQERQGCLDGVINLRLILNQLMGERRLREWLSWPTNCFASSPSAVLFFTCHGDSWARKQVLHMALLSALSSPAVQLVIHGFPWSSFITAVSYFDGRSVVLSNGPMLPSATTTLVQTQPENIPLLAARFLGDAPVLTENLQLLHLREAILLDEEHCLFTHWPGHSLDRVKD